MTDRTLLDLVQTFSQEERQKLCLRIFDTTDLIKPSKSIDSFKENLLLKTPLCCPECKQIESVCRYGKSNGRQRYRCSNCGKTFYNTAYTFLHASKKPIPIWLAYLDCMARGFSIRKSAKIVDISINTAFVWRHKILDSLQRFWSERTLDGIVEAKEYFFKLSFKGNRQISTAKEFIGKRHGFASNQVSVPCAVNLNNQAVMNIACVGPATPFYLQNVFGHRLHHCIDLQVDKPYKYKSLAKLLNLQLKYLDVNNSQKVNDFGIKLNKFYSSLHGVATKYLHNYLVWFGFLYSDNLNQQLLSDKIMEKAANGFCSYTYNTYNCRSVIPI